MLALEREIWLLAAEADDLLGFLSYLPDHRPEALGNYSPAAYVTTIAVQPHARAAGVGSALYARLREDAFRQGIPYLLTRTWSTNRAHLRLLSRLGFREVERVDGERGPGVDTVYLASEVTAP
jgi:ribosomal protein S18 acetylase RimI-like enzyme